VWQPLAVLGVAAAIFGFAWWQRSTIARLVNKAREQQERAEAAESKSKFLEGAQEVSRETEKQLEEIRNSEPNVSRFKRLFLGRGKKVSETGKEA
jgi:cytoskeletal protein RodZ